MEYICIFFNFIDNNIANIISIIGVILTIYFGYRSLKAEKKLKTMDWAEVIIAMNQLLKRMKRDKFVPDLIVTPGARGAILAELLLGYFSHDIPVYTGISIISSVRKISCINGYEKINSLKNWDIFIPKSVFESNNFKILIVDDFTITGTFPENIKKLFIEKGFSETNIKTMYVVITSAAKASFRTPDYFYKIVDNDDYYFPWGKANTG